MNRMIKFVQTQLFLLLLCLIVFGILLSLGFWQLKRLAWKEELIATIEARVDLPPKSIEAVLEKLYQNEDVEYMPVQVDGFFQHSSERHYYATHNSVPGWFVFTPLQIENERIIFVNRGFVPTILKSALQRKESQIEGKVRIVGLVRVPPEKKPNLFTPDNRLEENEFYWRSLNEMISSSSLPSEYRVEPFFVDAESIPNLAYPQGGTTLIQLPNNHLHYAITWFGLAVVLVIICGGFLRSRWKES